MAALTRQLTEVGDATRTARSCARVQDALQQLNDTIHASAGLPLSNHQDLNKGLAQAEQLLHTRKKQLHEAAAATAAGDAPPPAKRNKLDKPVILEGGLEEAYVRWKTGEYIVRVGKNPAALKQQMLADGWLLANDGQVDPRFAIFMQTNRVEDLPVVCRPPRVIKW